MSQRLKWIIGIGIVALLTSLMFNFSYIRTRHFDKVQAQANFMYGEGLIAQADNLLQEQHDISDVSTRAYEGIGYLRASSQPMLNQLGVHGVYGLSVFLDQAMFSLLGYTTPRQPPVSPSTKKHYQHVIQVFVTAMNPLGRINFGSISNQAIQEALNKAFQAMTPDERSQYEDWN